MTEAPRGGVPGRVVVFGFLLLAALTIAVTLVISLMTAHL